jgi:hypothetical protein
VLRLRARLVSAYYQQLRSLAKRFERASRPLAAVACYRALIDQILDAGRSTACRHARRYLDRLSALDSSVSDYGDLASHADYLQQLRERHGRKRSFWQPF